LVIGPVVAGYASAILSHGGAAATIATANGRGRVRANGPTIAGPGAVLDGGGAPPFGQLAFIAFGGASALVIIHWTVPRLA
jgi:hypothetical protein